MAKRRLTGKQIRYLFATGRLRASGSGKNRKVTYSKDAGAPKRAVIGGSKAAGLRGGSGAGGRRAPSKAERDATRASRIEAGRGRLTDNMVALGRSGDRERIAKATRGLTRAESRADATRNRRLSNLAFNARVNLKSGRNDTLRAARQKGQEALSASAAGQKLASARASLRSASLIGKDRGRAEKSVASSLKALQVENRKRRRSLSR